MYRAIAVLTVLVLATPLPSFGQESRISISLTGGAIRNLQPGAADDLPRYSVFPEIRASGKLLSLGRSGAALGVGVSWGYWNDRVKETSRACSDCATYTSRAQVVGARALLSLEKSSIPVAASVGLARHFVRAEYLGYGSGIRIGRPDLEPVFNTAEVGVSAAVPIFGPLRIVGGVRQFYRLGERDPNRYVEEERNLNVWQVGLGYALF